MRGKGPESLHKKAPSRERGSFESLMFGLRGFYFSRARALGATADFEFDFLAVLK